MTPEGKSQSDGALDFIDRVAGLNFVRVVPGLPPKRLDVTIGTTLGTFGFAVRGSELKQIRKRFPELWVERGKVVVRCRLLDGEPGIMIRISTMCGRRVLAWDPYTAAIIGEASG